VRSCRVVGCADPLFPRLHADWSETSPYHFPGCHYLAPASALILVRFVYNCYNAKAGAVRFKRSSWNIRMSRLLSDIHRLLQALLLQHESEENLYGTLSEGLLDFCLRLYTYISSFSPCSQSTMLVLEICSYRSSSGDYRPVAEAYLLATCPSYLALEAGCCTPQRYTGNVLLSHGEEFP